jgi:RNA-directed DNA polymerase
VIIDHMEYSQLISIEQLFQAWGAFRRGKGNKRDVQLFERNLEDNLFSLHHDLKNKTYTHGDYDAFFIHDPKRRHIHKAEVLDKVVHHLLYTYLYKVFDNTFIADSYSCRTGKGTHKGVLRLEAFTRRASNNYTKPCWVLKCDIKKFFANVDHIILNRLLEEKIANNDILRLLAEVIHSFHTDGGIGKGIPLGNLTSQVFANIYLNELDQFAKHTLKIPYYLRYADDFLVVANNRTQLKQYLTSFAEFLEKHLQLQMHPQKIVFRKLSWGIDFLGYIVLPHYRLPRTKTKRRAFKKLKERINSVTFDESLQSYLGYFSHANAFEVSQSLKNYIWLWKANKTSTE